MLSDAICDENQRITGTHFMLTDLYDLGHSRAHSEKVVQLSAPFTRDLCQARRFTLTNQEHMGVTHLKDMGAPTVNPHHSYGTRGTT